MYTKETHGATMEPFSGNQALQLLWILEKENHLYNLELTEAEVKHLRLCLLEDWGNLTTPYRKELVTRDKLEFLSRVSNGLPIFK